jgi:hypothetical protein
MNVSELRQIIKEEIQKVLKEGKKTKMIVYGLKQSEDGNFYNTSPFIYFNTSIESEAKELANEYTNGQFTEYPGFYELEQMKLDFYEKI